jgi:hypothetical protein
MLLGSGSHFGNGVGGGGAPADDCPDCDFCASVAHVHPVPAAPHASRKSLMSTPFLTPASVMASSPMVITALP